MPGRNAYFKAMPQKPLDVPGPVAKAFLADLRAFHAESNAIKRDEIAARQAWILNQHLNKDLRTNDGKRQAEAVQAWKCQGMSASI